MSFILKVSSLIDYFRLKYPDIKLCENEEDAEFAILYCSGSELFKIRLIEDYNEMIKTKICLISCYFKFKNHKCKDLNQKCLCEEIKIKNIFN